ncbi:uncharacterized protein LOC133299317 [Gastrolobium bilobum]|uniref:uncharacterized protein LOC133299317 n=1 Tax=Gastrolobium bilobum TaxID=150636 RepID=UPI002AAF629F|nr:uncharacterized protein LOC133299317 [Gastrolobium bilobum]
MGEPNMNMTLSPSPSLSPSTPRCSPKLVKRMQEDICYRCRQKGHWSWYCPLKTPDTKTLSPSLNQNSPFSPKIIRCRCGHGFCEVRTTLSEKNRGRKYYACPIKRGAKCKGFVKWCDDPVEESDLQPPPIKYPECECGAGVCRRVKGTDNTDGVKYYFTCPVREDHGSCGYRVAEDELLSNTSIVCIQQSNQRTLHDFWGTDNDRGNDLSNRGDLLAQNKRMRIMDNSENHSLMTVSKISEGEDAALMALHSECVGFPEHESTPSRIRSRQREFQRHIFADSDAVADTSFDPCPTGWLGRLLFFRPTQSLKFTPPQPFFCCVFPSINPIIVPKQASIPDDPCERNQVAISSLVQHPQLSTGSERKPISKAQRLRQMVLFAQKQLLIDLETLDPHDLESMRKAAEATFAILDNLEVDYKQFSEHIWDFISLASSVAEMDQSMENSLTLEEHNKCFEEEKVRYACVHEDCVKTETLFQVSDEHIQSLCEEIYQLEAMLHVKQNQLKSCKLENLKIKTNLDNLKRNMLEAETALKVRAEQVEITRKLREERQAKQIAAKSALEKAKLELEY